MKKDKLGLGKNWGLGGIPLWCSGSRIWHCHCSGLGGWGTSTCHRYSPKKKTTKTKTKLGIWEITNSRSHAGGQSEDWLSRAGGRAAGKKWRILVTALLCVALLLPTHHPLCLGEAETRQVTVAFRLVGPHRRLSWPEHLLQGLLRVPPSLVSASLLTHLQILSLPTLQHLLY